MSKPVRIDDNVYREMEEFGAQMGRTTPKQVERSAILGKLLETSLTVAQLNELLESARLNRPVEISISLKKSNPPNFDSVFGNLELDRQSKSLASKVKHAAIWYEASNDFPGMIFRVYENGKRELGSIVNGRFVLASPPKSRSLKKK